MKTYSILATLLLGFSTFAYAADQQQKQDTAPKEGQPIQFSEAEKRLWMHDHMANIPEPIVINYEFAKTGTYEDGFEDSVTMKVEEVHDDGTVTVDLEFFTGHREQEAQPHMVQEITGNPVIGIYMQGDVYEMHRLTDGSWRYFQKRIKAALAENFTVEEIKVPYNGEQVAAKKYTISPYVKDPHRPEFDKFADKEYVFIFSEKVPGELYQIKTVIPNNIEKNAPPLIVEDLKFVGTEPLAQKTAAQKSQ